MKRTACANPAIGPASLLGPLLLSLALAGCHAGGPAAVVFKPTDDEAAFDAPRAVAADARGVYVLDETGQFYGLDPRGRLLAKTILVKTERGFPVGITPSPSGELLVADTHEARVLRLSGAGEKLGALCAGYGSEPGQFVYPQRIAVTPDEVYVTEYGFGVNNRVQVFAHDGTFLRTFGNYGKTGGAFARPCGIVVGPGDRIYVADASHRILVWTRAGEYLRDIGSEGREPGRLNYPFGLAADDSYLYVVEYGNHRVSRFTRDGGFAGVWGGFGDRPDQLTKPRDIACAGGFLYVADTGNDRIIRVRLDGLTWRQGS